VAGYQPSAVQILNFNGRNDLTPRPTSRYSNSNHRASIDVLMTP
jgi:hypothetical protein